MIYGYIWHTWSVWELLIKGERHPSVLPSGFFDRGPEVPSVGRTRRSLLAVGDEANHFAPFQVTIQKSRSLMDRDGMNIPLGPGGDTIPR